MERRNAFKGAYKTRVLLHLAAATHLSYAMYYDINYVSLPSLAVSLQLEPPMGGKFKYLTFLSGLLQAGYYMLALAHDVLGGQQMRRLRDYVLATYIVPLALTVSLTFWTLYAINREAIFPRVLDLIYPNWLNQAMHTYVVVYALVELCVTCHRYPRQNWSFAGLALLMAGYLAWVHLLWYRTGIWVYPFLGAFNWPSRLLFFVAVIGLSFVYYLLGQHVNFVLWVRANEQPTNRPTIFTKNA